MNKFIEAVKALDLAALRDIVSREPKWLTWSEPTGKNALHYLAGVRVGDDTAKQQASLDILKFLVKRGLDINSVHRAPDKNCGVFPATPLWYAYAKGRNVALWRHLLLAGADPDHCMWAIAWFDDVAGAELFLKRGAPFGKDLASEVFVGASTGRNLDLPSGLWPMAPTSTISTNKMSPR